MGDFLRFFGRGLASIKRFNQLDRLHATQATNFADQTESRLPLSCAAAESLTYFIGSPEEIVVFQNVDDCVGCCASNWVSGESPAQAAGAGCIHNFCTSGHCGERQPAAQRFCGNNQIRFYAVVLTSKHLARTAESTLDFVSDEEHTMVTANLHDDAKKLRWRCDEA